MIELNFFFFVFHNDSLHLLIIRNGAAKFIPMNSMPKYIAKPNAAHVAIIADKLPNSPSHGFDRTWSPIMQVITLGKLWKEKIKKKKIIEMVKWRVVNYGWRIIGISALLNYTAKPYLNVAIKRNVDVKYGKTDRVFRSSSWSNVRDANLATYMCLKKPLSTALAIVWRNASSHAEPLHEKQF